MRMTSFFDDWLLHLEQLRHERAQPWDVVRGVSGRGAQRRGPRGATFRGETAIDDRANATSSQNAENSESLLARIAGKQGGVVGAD